MIKRKCKVKNMKKIAIVTGNGRGFGKALSKKLTEFGYEEPIEVRSKNYNLKQAQDCKKLIDDVLSQYGRIDLLVNNLGNYVEGYIDKTSETDWHEMLDSNLNSAFYLSKYALDEIRNTKGKIINMGFSGMIKLSPPTHLVAYQVAKTGLLALTKAMAKEEIKHGVTVNMVSPGSMETTVEDDSVLEKIPIGRFAKLEKVMQAYTFILANDYMTGQNIEIAGGRDL